ncbi:hypothetical protein N9D94_07585 [Gammaproteobacteria bacterium]|nr:hypothetical protein [Gammaproteobacteria bacterium]
MWALVESDNVTQVFTRPKGITVGEVNYPSNIFMLWTASELEALGIYEIVIDNTNLKDKEYYINTNQSFDFADGVVTASYGVATAKPLDDVLFTAQEETDGLGTEGDVKQPGIRQGYKDTINAQAGGILQPTDWMVVRAAEGGTAVPSDIATWRAAVRTKSNDMCTMIDGAADVDALAALYAYTNTGTEESPVMERPLGEFPELGA